jgi:hypothetical protein
VTRLDYLKRQREFLKKELEPFLKEPHANPWAVHEEEKLRDVEKEIMELEMRQEKTPDYPAHD